MATTETRGMLAIHGIWADGVLLLWAEDAIRPAPAAAARAEAAPGRPHPGAAARLEPAEVRLHPDVARPGSAEVRPDQGVASAEARGKPAPRWRP